MRLVIKADSLDINNGKDAFILLDDSLSQTEILEKISEKIRIINPNEGLVIVNRVDSFWVSIHTKEQTKDKMKSCDSLKLEGK